MARKASWFPRSRPRGDRKYACLLVNRELVAFAALDFFAVHKPDCEHDHVPLNVSIGGWRVAIGRWLGRGHIDRIKVLLKPDRDTPGWGISALGVPPPRPEQTCRNAVVCVPAGRHTVALSPVEAAWRVAARTKRSPGCRFTPDEIYPDLSGEPATDGGADWRGWAHLHRLGYIY
jgi:hypothetical protein